MNDEIKEILAYFEEYVKITDMHDSEPMINWKDLKIVLDYITNLQHTEDLYNQLLKDYDELQERIEKAVEYMKDFIFEPILLQEDRKLIMCNENLRKFENILNGKGDE